MNIKIFLKECNNREVFKLLSIYVVSSWVILQVLSVIAEPFGLPIQSIPVLILILIIGFPLYIIFIWKSRLSKSWESDEDDTTTELLDKSKFRQMYFTGLGIIIFLSGLSVVIIIDNSFTSELSLPKMAQNDKIAVLKFTNNTGDEKLNIYGNMTEDWISHGITQNNAGQIISQDIVKSYTDAIKTQNINLTNNEILIKYLKPGKKITGSYFLSNNKLIFKSSIENGLTGETIISIGGIECGSENPLDCIKLLESKIVSYLVVEKTGGLSMESEPPTYEAYKAMLEAKVSYGEGELDKYLELLEKAIALDSNFFEPKSLKVGHYYNIGLFSKADSLINKIKENSGQTERQLYLLKMYKAAIDGDSRLLYNYHGYGYNIAPYELDTNASRMVITLQFVNKPKEVESIFNVISFDNLSLENCKFCVDRMYIMALANHELKNYSKTIELLEPYVDLLYDIDFFKAITTAYVFTNNKVSLDNLIQKLKLKLNEEDWLSLNYFAGGQFLLAKKKEEAKAYFNVVVNTETNKNNEFLKAESYYELGNYAMAEKIYSKLINENPDDSRIIKFFTALSKCYFKMGNSLEGNQLIDSLEKLKQPYQYGEIDYRLAEIYAAQNDEEKMFEYLLRSIASGNFYTNITFKNDTDFIPYLDSQNWKSIMTYWH